MAAKRELYEESGAVDFEIEPLCDYWAERCRPKKKEMDVSFLQR